MSLYRRLDAGLGWSVSTNVTPPMLMQLETSEGDGDPGLFLTSVGDGIFTSVVSVS